MNKPKVLILVHGGVAEYLCIGDVEVQVVDDTDNWGQTTVSGGQPLIEVTTGQ